MHDTKFHHVLPSHSSNSTFIDMLANVTDMLASIFRQLFTANNYYYSYAI